MSQPLALRQHTCGSSLLLQPSPHDGMMILSWCPAALELILTVLGRLSLPPIIQGYGRQKSSKAVSEMLAHLAQLLLSCRS